MSIKYIIAERVEELEKQTIKNELEYSTLKILELRAFYKDVFIDLHYKNPYSKERLRDIHIEELSKCKDKMKELEAKEYLNKEIKYIKEHFYENV